MTMRAAQGGDQVDGRAVEGDVQTAVRGAEHEQYGAECRHRVGERGQRDAQ
jgi:hypothetical protein